MFLRKNISYFLFVKEYPMTECEKDFYYRAQFIGSFWIGYLLLDHVKICMKIDTKSHPSLV